MFVGTVYETCCKEIEFLLQIDTLQFNVGTWSSPAMSGERPPSCSDCTLTAIDPHTLLMFGGYNGKGIVHIVDFASMVCVYVKDYTILLREV